MDTDNKTLLPPAPPPHKRLGDKKTHMCRRVHAKHESQKVAKSTGPLAGGVS